MEKAFLLGQMAKGMWGEYKDDSVYIPNIITVPGNKTDKHYLYVRSFVQPLQANPYAPNDTKAKKYGVPKTVYDAKEIISLMPDKKEPQTGSKMHLEHHARADGSNDLGINRQSAYSIVKATYDKDFYEQDYSDSSCHGAVQHT